MGTRLGIIAGSGEFPVYVLKEAQKRGLSCVVAGIRNEADSFLLDKASVFEWFEIDGILDVISFFKKYAIKHVVMAGKIDSRLIFKKKSFHPFSREFLARIKNKNPTTIIHAVIDFIASQGIEVLDPTEFISPALCSESVLTGVQPSQEVEEDIGFGWQIARKLADLDIGQTVIVKDKALVAVEGIEGTDAAIKRGGRLAGKGIVCIKVSRSLQDPRADLPAVGLNTVESLIDAGGKALCFEAEKIPFFQKNEAISLANSHNVAIVVKK